MSNTSSPLKATCHCGALTLIGPHRPKRINECQCTICRRYAAAWAYYDSREVRWENRPDANVRKYVWGDKDLEFRFCDECGCVICWWPIDPTRDPEMGLNTRMCLPEDILGVDREFRYGMLSNALRAGGKIHPESKEAKITK